MSIKVENKKLKNRVKNLEAELVNLKIRCDQLLKSRDDYAKLAQRSKK